MIQTAHSATVGEPLPDVPDFPTQEFGELLKRLREEAGLTQDRAAGLVGVSRPTFAQWEGSRHLPAEDRVRMLDDLLKAGGALVRAFERTRGGPRVRTSDIAERASTEAARPLLQVFRDIRAAMLDQLCYDSKGRPLGWRHNLVPSGTPVAALSTSYVMKALTMLGGLDPRTTALVGRLFDLAVRDDEKRIVGWKASTTRVPRIETTAIVFEALQRVGADLDVQDAIRALRDLVDDTARTRPIILTTALEAVLRLAPDSSLAVELTDALLALRVDFDGVLLWPEKVVDRRQPKLEPSVAHTARAVNALRDVPGDKCCDAVAAADNWIGESTNLHGVTESIARDLDEGEREELAMFSFTSAHVVRALAGSPTPSPWRIKRALEYIWERYDPELHLWAWGNGDVPAWMVMDAIGALHDAALALATGPVG